MKITKKYAFCCPECKSKKVVLVRPNAEIIQSVEALTENNVTLGKIIVKGEGQNAQYCCGNCSYPLADSEDELRMKYEKEFFVVPASFPEDIKNITMEAAFDTEIDEEKFRGMLQKYLASIEIEIDESAAIDDTNIND